MSSSTARAGERNNYWRCEVEERLVLRSKEAAKMLCISERHLWQLSINGEIPNKQIGEGKRRLRLYPIEALKKWLESDVK
jgi:excisionase family DNA binding protein